MTMTRNEVARWLEARDHFCILTHGGPDGDTLGSAGALCLGLRSLGKTAVVLENSETTDRLAYCVAGLTVTEVPDNATIVSVDVASPKMFPPESQDLIERIQLRIDHHGSATPFGENELVDPTAGACAEIIYDILMELGVKLTPEMAIPLYTGTSTDTGCFRFANTKEHTFLVAAACAASGANLQPINQALFDTVSLSKLKVQAWVTEHTHFFCDGQAAVCPLPATLAEELGVKEEEVGGMAGFIRSIEGVKMAATLREDKEGKVFLSTRAIPGYDCAKVCEIFGGGGHKGAAGGNTTLPLQEATAIMMAEMKKQFEQ